jgi:hypothetical protein
MDSRESSWASPSHGQLVPDLYIPTHTSITAAFDDFFGPLQQGYTPQLWCNYCGSSLRRQCTFGSHFAAQSFPSPVTPRVCTCATVHGRSCLTSAPLQAGLEHEEWRCQWDNVNLLTTPSVEDSGLKKALCLNLKSGSSFGVPANSLSKSSITLMGTNLADMPLMDTNGGSITSQTQD